MVSVFWLQFPMGSRLDWNLVSRQLNTFGAYLYSNGSIIFARLPWILKAGNSIALPLIKDFDHVCRKACPFEARSLRIAFYVGGCLPLFMSMIVVFALMYILQLSTVFVAGILAGAIMLIWAVVVSTAFFLWFSLYRYPVFEIVYPQIRGWMLRHNASVYHPLPAHSGSEGAEPIRVVRIKPGQRKTQLECELVPGNLSDTTFEALSYVWGVTLKPYRIKVDGKTFYITYNLYSALQELRRQDTERIVWIDAMCMNQSDLAEKSSQVQLMRTIYFRASQVIVWLGKGSTSTSSAFDFVQRFASIPDDEQDARWEKETASPGWRQMRREFFNILAEDWWRRAWIIQEIVVGHCVLVQRGKSQANWDELYKVLRLRQFLEMSNSPTTDFAETIQDLRAEFAAGENTSLTLLQLAHRFALQSATFGSDKLYALLGLLRPDSPSRIIPDYSKSPDDVFIDFTLSSITHDHDYKALSVAAGLSIPTVSWCRDWRLENDGLFPIQYFTTLRPQLGEYCASGSSVPVFKEDVSSLVLSVQGFEIDCIVKYGACEQRLYDRPVDWSLALQVWEYIAGVAQDEQDSKRRIAFNRTITAGCWPEGDVDWKTKLKGRHPAAPEHDNKEFLRAVQNACLNRRFFITRQGRFGIGPWDMKVGDKIIVVLGHTVPFILRESKKPKAIGSWDRTDEVDGLRGAKFWKFVGEAYCDGMMYYDGNIGEDIEAGRLSPRFYHLI